MFWVASRVAPAAIVTPPVRFPALSVRAKTEPPVSVIVPPAIVPPSSRQAPMLGDKASVVPALFNVPVKFTAAPVALNLPTAAVVNDPPRLTVAALAVIVPALIQLAPRIVNVWPLATVMGPWKTAESLL